MRVLVLSVNHRTAPVAVREKLAVAGERLERALSMLRQRYPASECVLVSTCNRTELYVVRATHHPPTADDLRRFLAELGGVGVDAVTAASVHREQEQALGHLFRVCAGLDSMVLGEPQILGQVRKAYESAVAAQTVGPVLHRVFQQAVAAAKKVRTTSGIDAGRVSIASVAVDFARQIFEGFGDKTVVGIGAGDIAKATLRHLIRLDPGRLWVVNRSVERAQRLAEELGIAAPRGGARPWDDLDAMLVEADVIITGTGAREPIITVDRFRPLVRKRRNRPLFIVDIAVPRDVEAGVGSLSNVYLYNVDDLQQVVSANLGHRREQVTACEAELHEAALGCYRAIQHRDMSGLIRQLREQLHDIGQAERDRTLRKLAAADGRDPAALEVALDEHTQRVINKILHLPLSQLDHRDPDAPVAFYAAALRRLFKLEEPDISLPADAHAADAQVGDVGDPNGGAGMTRPSEIG